MNLATVKQSLHRHADKKRAKILQGFFKTGPGEYAEGDVFLGLTAPIMRELSRKFKALPLSEVTKLLKSAIHEERMIALLILIEQYRKADAKGKEKIYRIYLSHTKYINNWDLVDVTVKDIVGAHLFEKSKAPLYKLAKSKSLWERRIAIIATSYFIGRNQFDHTLKISELLINDQHDLIHKAVGWMLREVGKRDLACEEKFLKKHCKTMPRTMLRYAIEKFPQTKRKAYLKGTV